MADPGIDYDEDDLTFAERTGVQVLVKDVLRSVTTPAGALWWAPTATLDLRDYLNASLSPQDVADLARRCAALHADDPRMAVACGLTFAQRTLTAAFTITPVDGETFTVTITIGADGLATLDIQGAPSA